MFVASIAIRFGTASLDTSVVGLPPHPPIEHFMMAPEAVAQYTSVPSTLTPYVSAPGLFGAPDHKSMVCWLPSAGASKTWAPLSVVQYMFLSSAAMLQANACAMVVGRSLQPSLPHATICVHPALNAGRYTWPP